MVQPAAKPDGDVPLRGGDERAADFAAQFQSSFRVLWLVAVGIIGDASLAEDVVQEAAIIALGKLDQFRTGTNFTAWTSQIVRNVARNRARRERRHHATVTDPSAIDERPSSLGPTPEASRQGIVPGGAEEQRRFDDRILRALRDVGEVARACLLLRTLEGLEYAEISRLLEIPEGTAMSHVHRTRRYLRDRLADVWEERTGRPVEGA
jgi:RNA polymerase sigma-70 factor (ECF subfamily)